MGQSDDGSTSATGTSHRGFASMDEAKQRAIASKGGQSVPPEKRSFSQNPDLAAQAGRKGGENVPSHERSFSRNRALAAEAGRKGGQSSRSGARQRAEDHGDSGPPIPGGGGGSAGQGMAGKPGEH
jgi:general stress protein YciG